MRRWTKGFVPKKRLSPRLSVVLPLVKKMIEEKPFLTYKLLQQHLLEHDQVKTSFGTLCTALKQSKVSRKKVVARKIYGSLDRILDKREQFRRDFDASRFNQVISVDETHFYSHSSPAYGYSHVGGWMENLQRRIEQGEIL